MSETIQEENKEKTLKSDLGIISALSIVVGTVLGVGAFMKPPAVLALTGADSYFAMFAWILGGCLSMVGGLTMCELGVLFPRTGGLYVFLEEIYHKKVAFLYGWMMTIFFGPATVGALAGYFGSVFSLIFDVNKAYIPLITFGVIAFVLFVNSVSVKAAGGLQTLATVCKLTPVSLLVIFGLWKGNGQILSTAENASYIVAPFSLALLSTLFAYDGWAQVATLAGELKNPKKILPRAIIGGLSFLVLIYLLINLSFLKVLSPTEMVNLGHGASSIIAQKLFGINGGNILAVGIMISILGGLNGYVMIVSRICMAMADRGQLPFSKTLSKIDNDSSTPVNATIFLCILGFIFCQLLDADRLADTSVFAIWIFYLLAFAGVIVLRIRKPNLERSYKVPLYPVVPLLAISGAIYIIYGMLRYNTMLSISSIIITLIGLPLLYFVEKNRENTRFRFSFIKKKYIVLASSALLFVSLFGTIKVLDHRPLLKVAVESSNIPSAFEDTQTGELDGFSIELMNEIAKEGGLKIQYMPIAFQNLLESLDKKIADVVVGQISVTDERKTKAEFSESFAESNLVLIINNNSNFSKLEEIQGTIVVKEETTSDEYLINLKMSNVLRVSNEADLIKLFNHQKAEALVSDRLLATYWLNAGLIKDVNLIDLPNSNEKYAFAFVKENESLRKLINETIKKMKKDGSLEQLLNKWYLVNKKTGAKSEK